MQLEEMEVDEGTVRQLLASLRLKRTHGLDVSGLQVPAAGHETHSALLLLLLWLEH